MKKMAKRWVFLATILLLADLTRMASAACVTTLQPGNDLNAAVQACPAGTAFTLTAGTYRMQSVSPLNGDTLTGAPGALLNGSQLVTSFSTSGSLWTATGLPVVPDDARTGICDSAHPACVHPQDVYIDDSPLINAGSVGAVTSGKYFFDTYNGTMYIADNPTGHKIEVGATSYAFYGPGTGVTIQNLTIEKYANVAQTGAIGGNQWGGSNPVNWTIQNCEIRLNHGSGVALLSDSQVLGNFIHHNGMEGFGIGGGGVLLANNEISYNNYAGYDCGWECGGGKFWATTDLVVRNNNVHDNLGPGLWTDTDNINTLYANNVILNNDLEGIQHEISYKATIINNTLMGNGKKRDAGLTSWGWGSQIMLYSSQNVEVSGNTLVVPPGGANGIGLVAQDRGSGVYGPWILRNNSIHDNDITYSGATGFTGSNGSDLSNSLDYNHYHAVNLTDAHWMWPFPNSITWGQFRATGQEAHGTLDSVFRGVITTPVPGTTLPSGSVTFAWSPASGASQYRLTVGSALGQGSVTNVTLTGTSQLVSGIPTDGRTLYVRLQTCANSSWQAPLDYTYQTAATQAPPDRTFVTAKQLGTLLNNFQGWVGMQLQVGASPLTVTAVGRINIAGNTHPHQVKIARALDGQDVPGSLVTLLPAGANNEFNYAYLSAPVVLSANTAYYVVSHEDSNGDLWYNADTALTTSPDGSIPFAIYQPDGGSWSPPQTYGVNHSYVPTDFRYLPVNQAPTVSAGTNQTITLPGQATLTGTATDDGLPNPPGQLSYQWSMVSGPMPVTFGNATALSTTASFSSPGTYVLQLTANDSLLTSAPSQVTITINPHPVTATPAKQGLGVYHWNSDYQINSSVPSLIDGAQQVQSLGSQIISVSMSPGYNSTEYLPSSAWGSPINNLTDLAKSPPFVQLFNMPFKTYILTAYTFTNYGWTNGGHPRGALGTARSVNETAEIHDLAKHLLQTYQGTGKTFIIMNWEGDWWMNEDGSYNRFSNPTAIQIQANIDFYNARYAGVQQARSELSVSSVKVQDAIEINLIDKIRLGYQGLLNAVVPNASSDLIAYSSYESQVGTGATLRQTIMTDVAFIQNYPGVNNRPVFIGEYGFNENGDPNAGADTQTAAQAYLDAGALYVNDWAIEDNSGTRGMALVRPNATHSPQWIALHNMLVSGNHAPVAQNQPSITVNANSSTPVTLTATDADNDILVYSTVTAPAHGSLSGNTPALIYTPNSGYTGTDSFTFKANDGLTDSNIATVSISVTPPPVPNLVLTKTASVPTAKSGDTITFTIQYQNTGTGSAVNAVIADVIPAGTTLVPGSISNGGTNNNGTIQWNLGTVAAGTTGNVNFQVQVN